MRISPLLAVELLPLVCKRVYLPLYCPSQCVKLIPGVHLVLHQQFGLFHIAVKLLYRRLLGGAVGFCSFPSRYR